MATAAAVLVVLSAVTYYVCWRWSENARVRRMAKKRANSSSGGGPGSAAAELPSPVPVLPRWLPFIGGHTLQLGTEKVTTTSLLCCLHAHCNPTNKRCCLYLS